MNANYDNSIETRQRLYEQTKTELASQQLANSTTYDTSILTLSSAFLGLSFAFIKDVVTPISAATYLSLLYVSWVCFCLAIISAIGSFMFAQYGFRVLRQGAERYYIQGDQSAFNVSVVVSRRIDIINSVPGALFIAGTILTLVFVITNVTRIAAMPTTNTPAVPTEQRGQPTNTFQRVPVQPAAPASTPQPASSPPAAPVQSKIGT
jgi:hypothetical protein